jgi:hypothetical protein
MEGLKSILTFPCDGDPFSLFCALACSWLMFEQTRNNPTPHRQRKLPERKALFRLEEHMRRFLILNTARLRPEDLSRTARWYFKTSPTKLA